MHHLPGAQTGGDLAVRPLLLPAVHRAVERESQDVPGVQGGARLGQGGGLGGGGGTGQPADDHGDTEGANESHTVIP